MTTRIESLDLIHLQLALECKSFNSEGLLVRIPGPEPDEIARYQSYHFAEGWARYFRAIASAATPVKQLPLGPPLSCNITRSPFTATPPTTTRRRRSPTVWP